MRFRDYVRDRLWFYCIAALSFGLILLFLSAYRVSSQLAAFITGIFFIFILSEELLGFMRKENSTATSYTSLTAWTKNTSYMR